MKAPLCVMVYDVADDRRRRKLHALLRQYGVAVQESAFEARLDIGERRRVIERAARILDPTADRFVLYPVPEIQERSIVEVGLPRPAVQERLYFIV